MTKVTDKDIAAAFKKALVKKGLLGAKSGTQLVHKISGEDKLLERWKEVGKGFVYKGCKPYVQMGVTRQYFEESICWPIISIA